MRNWASSDTSSLENISLYSGPVKSNLQSCLRSVNFLLYNVSFFIFLELFLRLANSSIIGKTVRVVPLIGLDWSSHGSRAHTGVTLAFVVQHDTPSLPVDIALTTLDRSLETSRRIALVGWQA